MNPENPDEHKISECDWLIIDGYSIRKGAIGEVLKRVVKMADKKAMIVLLSVTGLNEIGKEEAKELIVKESGGSVEIGDEARLEASERDQSYLPVREDQMEFRLNFFKMVKE